jgi:hypothetical protein
VDDAGAHVVLRVRVNVLQKLQDMKERVFYLLGRAKSLFQCSGSGPPGVHRIHMFLAGSGSGSICQRHGSADPDPDPHQNVMDPEH